MLTLDSIEVRALACVRAGRLVFRDLMLRAQSGHLVAVEGPNGSGKTSLLRALAGLLTPYAGTILFGAGQHEYSDAEERRRFVGWLGHQDAIKPQLTPAESIRFFAKLYGSSAADSSECLDSVGLTRVADLPCQYLSAGQKRRLALARLRLLSRPLWLLDEPFATLDADGKILVTTFVGEHLAAGGIAILATHDPIGIPCERLRLL